MTAGRLVFAISAAFAAGCVSSRDVLPDGVEQIGLHRYRVVDGAWAKANETCPRLGRTMIPLPWSLPTTVANSNRPPIDFECILAYEVLPAGKDTYEIRVPTQEMPLTDFTIPATTNIPSRVVHVPDYGPVGTKVTQLATEHCAKMRKQMKVTDSGFDMGPGFFFIFKCVSAG